MKRVAFYYTAKDIWTLIPLIAISMPEKDAEDKIDRQLLLGLHFLCFGVSFIIKKYD